MGGPLSTALLQAVRDQHFEATADALRGGAPVAAFPSIDLAVVDFAADAPRCANVLFSRDHPQGLATEWHGVAGAVADVRYLADLRDAQGRSVAWLPGADWSHLRFRPLAAAAAAGTPGDEGDDRKQRFVAPYPASLLKLMVAIGVALAVDCGLCDWPEAAAPMVVDSDNDATTACVALLHRTGAVGLLHDQFAAFGLATLRLDGTRPDGGWRNADGAGVGRIVMTAWDTARLLWLIDPGAPPPPWRRPGAPPLLQARTRDLLMALLARQRHDRVLSSGSLLGLPGHVQGLPDAPAFAHKTGTTENYAADAGIVRGADGTRYIVALLSSLGSRYAPHPRCATTWRVPALGAAIHRLLAPPAG